MSVIEQYRMLARYNRLANERLYEACARLNDSEYRRERKGSFGSIHGLLNHMLLADRIWMARFEGGGQTTPPLGTILFTEFGALRAARVEEDARIERFCDKVPAAFFERTIEYVNSRGKRCADQPLMTLAHFFNHQTHHRGQVHVMLSQTDIAPPALDLHRLINPV